MVKHVNHENWNEISPNELMLKFAYFSQYIFFLVIHLTDIFNGTKCNFDCAKHVGRKMKINKKKWHVFQGCFEQNWKAANVEFQTMQIKRM